MPEGPSIVILREQVADFEGRTIVRAQGSSKDVATDELAGQPILALRTFGKHFLIRLADRALRIHLLMFGTYLINETKEAVRAKPRLSLFFDDDSALHFYTCSIKTLSDDLDSEYDWRGDVMSDAWSPALALKKLRAQPDLLACDALLYQTIFAGVGNIIKNEVLFRVRLHPLSKMGDIPAAKLRALVAQARAYSFDFLAWKKEGTLKQHWLAHTRKICPRCNISFLRGHLGKTARRSFYCARCQLQYPLTPARSGNTPQSRKTPPAS